MRLPEGYESRYLAETVGGALQDALAEVCVMRPRDPIEFLAQCLYRHAERVARDRQDLEAKELLEQETIQSLLESQHLTAISHEDDVLKSERERRKRIYLDREREVEILNSPRSSRSRKSSMSSDLGASGNFAASIGLRMPPTSSNPNELTVPGPVPPSVDPSTDQVTDDAADPDLPPPETQNIDVPPAESEKEQEAAAEEEGGDKTETEKADIAEGQSEQVEGQSEVNVRSDPQEPAPPGEEAAEAVAPQLPAADSADAAPGVSLEDGVDKEESQQPPQDNENDNTKVAQAADTNETPGETEVIGDSSQPEGKPTTAPSETAPFVPAVAPADGEANKELYTIGEQEED